MLPARSDIGAGNSLSVPQLTLSLSCVSTYEFAFLKWTDSVFMQFGCVQSDKLTSPHGSLVEGLNRETSSSSESTLSTHVPAVDPADGNSDISQFRSPLLRQMMGNKLAAGYRPTSANSDVASAPGDAVTLVTGDGTAAVEMTIGSSSNTDRPLAETASSSFPTSFDDGAPICDKPVDTWSRIPESATRTDLDRNRTSSKSTAVLPVSGSLRASVDDEIAVCDEPLDADSLAQILQPAAFTDRDHDRASAQSPTTQPFTASFPDSLDDETAVCDQPLDPSPSVTRTNLDYDRISSESATVQPAAGSLPASIEDEIAVCDEPLDPSPRILEPATQTDLDHEETSAKSTVTQPVADEASVENTPTVMDPLCRSYDDHSQDELCVEDRPSETDPHPEVDTYAFAKPDSKATPSSSRSAHRILDDEEEVSPADMLSEPSPCLCVDVRGPRKPGEHALVVDEDRDIDTAESDVKVDLAADTSKWNGVGKSSAADSPSTHVNGYSDVDVRL